MTLPPDKLFREGLGHFHKPAPASAWDRIETSLDRRKPKRMWIKIAASIIVLIATAVMIWPKEDQSPSIAATHLQEQQPSIIDEVPTPIKEDIPVETTNPKSKVERVENKRTKTSVQIARVSSPSIIRDLPTIVSHNSEKNSVDLEAEMAQQTTETNVIVKETAIIDAHQPALRNITGRKTLTYTSAEVNARFKRKDIPLEATPELKKASGLQKVIDLAMNLKNDDSMYGDLRQKKNEILTINFPDKKREINR